MKIIDYDPWLQNLHHSDCKHPNPGTAAPIPEWYKTPKAAHPHPWPRDAHPNCSLQYKSAAPLPQRGPKWPKNLPDVLNTPSVQAAPPAYRANVPDTNGSRPTI